MMKRPGIFAQAVVKAAAAVALMVAFVVSCTTETSFETTDTDSYYITQWGGKDVVVKFAEFGEGKVNGKYYVSEEDGVSAPSEFSCDVDAKGKGTLVLFDGATEYKVRKLQAADGKVSAKIKGRKWVFRKLEEPEEGLPCQGLMPTGRKYNVATVKDVVYGHSKGYWTSYPSTPEDFAKIYFRRSTQLIGTNMLDLKMDIYYPRAGKKETIGARPLVLLIHGGAFYNGDKAFEPLVKWANMLASRGYVVASINYRLGFRPAKSDIIEAGYRAVQDAHAALRFLLHNADKYRIDEDNIYVAGTSAGAIAALNLAFMREGDQPLEDLGPLNEVSPELTEEFTIKGVINMWGALENIDLLKNAPRTAILSVHGDADDIVPYDYDYPFNGYFSNIGSKKHPLNEKVFPKMYGSKAIDRDASKYKIKSELFTVKGAGHEPHIDPTYNITQTFYDIANRMVDFLYRLSIPKPTSLETAPGGVYKLNGTSDVASSSWLVDGGVILSRDNDTARIMFFEDAPSRSLRVSGLYRSGIGFDHLVKP